MADVVAISLVLALLNIAGHPLLLSYQWHKLLHIFGMVNSFIHNQDDYLKKK
jgi:hypothetical protein